MDERKQFSFIRLGQCTFEQALRLRNRGFEGYYFDVTVTMDQLLRSFAVNGIRPELSLVACADGHPVGFVFLAVKMLNGRKAAWNGGTGVIPEYRGYGLSTALMQEVKTLLTEQEVDRAYLEVLVQNSRALSAYEKGGFHIADRLIGLTRDGALEPDAFKAGECSGFKLQYGAPRTVKDIPYYREIAAWECQWQNMAEGESLIIRAADGEPAAYALFKRNYSDEGMIKSIVLYQCEAAPGRVDRTELFRMALKAVFGPKELDCSRTTANLSGSNPDLIDMLKEAGFKERYQQHLMVMDL